MLTSRIQLQQLYWVSEGYQYFGQCVFWIQLEREREMNSSASSSSQPLLILDD